MCAQLDTITVLHRNSLPASNIRHATVHKRYTIH